MSTQSNLPADKSTTPRAIIHKKILDAAQAHPTASIEKLSNIVNGASISLVERVLDEYGDPADEHSEEELGEDNSMDGVEKQGKESGGNEAVENIADTDEEDKSRFNSTLAPTLTPKQRQTIEAIQVSPNATQQDLAEQFGVSQSTISNRLNSIEGFEWHSRAAFIAAVIATDEESMSDNTNGEELTSKTTAESKALEVNPSLQPRATTPMSDPTQNTSNVEDTPKESKNGEIAGAMDTKDFQSVLIESPELAYKIVRACLDADEISESEEKQIFTLITAGLNHSP